MSDQQAFSEIKRAIEFGLDAQRFMESDIGRYLTKRANAEVEAAQEDLLAVDPTDAKAVQALQNKAVVARTFLMWMGEAVTEGEQAEYQFQQMDSPQ